MIIAIVSVAVASMVLSTTSYTLNSRVEVVKSHLRYAQTRAMNSNTVWGIYFSSGSAYSLFRNGNNNDRVTIPGEDSSTVTLPQGMSVADPASTGIVSFDSLGKPHTDAGAAMAQGQRSLSVSLGDKTQSITITPNTGYIP